MKKIIIFSVMLLLVFGLISCDLFNSSDDSAPGTPTNVSATAASTTSITVSWTAVTGANGYFIYRSTSATGTFAQIGSSTTTSYTDTGLSPGTTYYYKVAAFDDSKIGSQSEANSATTNTITIDQAIIGTWVRTGTDGQGIGYTLNPNGSITYFLIIDSTTDINISRGSFTTGGGGLTVIFNETHGNFWNWYFELDGDDAVFGNQWYNESQLKTILMENKEILDPDDDIEEDEWEDEVDEMLDVFYSSDAADYTISSNGNSLTLSWETDDGTYNELFTKRP